LTTAMRTGDPALVVESVRSDGVTVVRFRAARIISEANAHEMGQGLKTALETGGPRPRVLVDLAGVQLLSSAAIAKLLMFKRRVQDQGGEVRLCRLTPHVARAFAVTNLSTFFSIHPDVDSARDSFGENLF
jgi:anti-sigma B factor antagonist